MVWAGSPQYARLVDDFNRLIELKKQSTIFNFKAAGDPPERYLFIFDGRGLRKVGSEIKPQDHHEVEVRLGAEYPRARPSIQWKTPILHPNIFGGTVCLGKLSMEWTMGIHLDMLAEILWDYARLKLLNPYSAGPGGGDATSHWDQLREQYDFPVDKRPLRDKVAHPREPSSIVTPVPAEDVVFLEDDSGVCGLGDLGADVAYWVERVIDGVVAETAEFAAEGRACAIAYGPDIERAVLANVREYGGRLDPVERQILKGLAGAILCEAPDGSVEYAFHRDPRALANEWATVTSAATAVRPVR